MVVLKRYLEKQNKKCVLAFLSIHFNPIEHQTLVDPIHRLLFILKRLRNNVIDGNTLKNHLKKT